MFARLSNLTPYISLSIVLLSHCSFMHSYELTLETKMNKFNNLVAIYVNLAQMCLYVCF